MKLESFCHVSLNCCSLPCRPSYLPPYERGRFPVVLCLSQENFTSAIHVCSALLQDNLKTLAAWLVAAVAPFPCLVWAGSSCGPPHIHHSGDTVLAYHLCLRDLYVFNSSKELIAGPPQRTLSPLLHWLTQKLVWSGLVLLWDARFLPPKFPGPLVLLVDTFLSVLPFPLPHCDFSLSVQKHLVCGSVSLRDWICLVLCGDPSS